QRVQQGLLVGSRVIGMGAPRRAGHQARRLTSSSLLVVLGVPPGAGAPHIVPLGSIGITQSAGHLAPDARPDSGCRALRTHMLISCWLRSSAESWRSRISDLGLAAHS